MANHPIFSPAFHGDVAAVKKRLQSEPEAISVRDAKGLTPLHVAASRGKEEVVHLLLEQGANVHGPSEGHDWTPIVFAAYRGHVEAVRVLIEFDAGVTDKEGNPIHYAGQRKHREICRLLVEHGAVDNLVDGKDRKDPDLLGLFRAAYSYDPDSVEEILSRRPELVASKDKNGRTPLHEVCTQGDTKTAKVLLRFGADPTVADANDQTPMDRAAAHRQHSVTKLLDSFGSSS